MKKIICLLTVLLVMFFCMAGCKKKSQQAETVKTPEQIKAEAQSQINQSNMEEELQNLEKEINSDISSQ